jgi:hypothetical protein
VPLVAEDWRVIVKLQEEGLAERVAGYLHEQEVEADVRRRLGQRVAVSAGDSTVFLYADTESAAREADRVVHRVLADRGLEAETSLDRWHPVEQRWEPASEPLPRTAEERERERERLEQQEEAESEESGLAAWEVRVELPSHAAERELAERLEAEDLPVVSRWQYLIVGAANEDDANELAERLQREAPTGAVLHVEPGGGLAWQAIGNNPFAVFGGLAG